MFALIPFFKKLTNVEDIRTPIRDTYQLERLLSNETIRYCLVCWSPKGETKIRFVESADFKQTNKQTTINQFDE